LESGTKTGTKLSFSYLLIGSNPTNPIVGGVIKTKLEFNEANIGQGANPVQIR